MGFLKEHKLILVSASLMAILVASPAFLFPLISGQGYQGINIGNWGADDFYYLAIGKDILEGHGQGNPFLSVGKNFTEAHQSYVAYVLLKPIRLLGLADKVNVVNIYNIYDFFGAIILILAIYFFILYISGEKLLAALTALFVVGGYDFVFWYHPFFSPFSQNLNVYARPFTPVFSSVVFFFYLNFLVRGLKKNSWKLTLYSALFFGALFYIYFYAWTFALAINGALFLIYIFQKNYDRAKKVFAVSFIGLALGAYNLFQVYLFSQADWGKRALFWLSSFSRAPIFNKPLFLLTIFLTIFAYLKRQDKNLGLLFALLIAGWVALNQQVITDRVVQPHHYIWYLITPALIIVGLYAIWFLISSEKYRKFLFLVLVLAIFTNASARQYYGTLDTYETKQYAQNYASLIDALNKDKNPKVVLTSDWFYGHLIAVYTSHDLFWNDTAIMFNVPLERIKEALYVYLYLNKESRNDFIGYLNRVTIEHTERQERYMTIYEFLEGWESGLLYNDYLYRAFVKKEPEMLNFRQKLLSDYDHNYELLARNNGQGILELLKKDGVSYIVWDRNKQTEWNLSFLRLKLLVTHNNIDLYEVIY